MKKSLKKLWAALLCFVIMLTGCDKDESLPSEIIGADSEPEQAAFFPIETCGVVLEKAVERAVSLSPAVTEIICELGFGDALVGISGYCDYPADLPVVRVGSPENPDIDAITGLKPDAVFTLTPLSERETYILGQSGIVVLTARVPLSVEEYALMYDEIAAAFFGKEPAEGETDMRRSAKIGSDTQAALKKAADGLELGKFVYITGKLTVAGWDTFESSVLGLAGENVCKRVGYVTLQDYWEELTELTPDFMIADSSLSEEEIRSSATLKKLLDNGTELRFVSSRCFERPTARTAEIFAELKAAC